MKNILLALLSFTLLSSCKDKVYECDTVDEEMHEFFPYSMGDTLRFQSGSAVRKVPVTGIHKSDPYTCTERGGVFMVKECECRSDGNISAVGDSMVFVVYVEEQGTRTSHVDLQVTVNDLTLEAGMVHLDKWYISGNVTEEHNMVISNINYPSVVVYTGDTIANPQLKLWRMMFVRGVGIVKFYERLPDKEWVKM